MKPEESQRQFWILSAITRAAAQRPSGTTALFCSLVSFWDKKEEKEEMNLLRILRVWRPDYFSPTLLIPFSLSNKPVSARPWLRLVPVDRSFTVRIAA